MKTQENKNKRCESKNRKNDRVQYVEHGLSFLHWHKQREINTPASVFTNEQQPRLSDTPP